MIRSRRQEREARAQRKWHGYVTPEGIDTRYVRLADRPDSPGERVVLDIVNADGTRYCRRCRACASGSQVRGC